MNVTPDLWDAVRRTARDYAKRGVEPSLEECERDVLRIIDEARLPRQPWSIVDAFADQLLKLTRVLSSEQLSDWFSP